MSLYMNNLEQLTLEYVKIYQKIYMARQDIFDSLNIFNGKASIQCSTEQSDFKIIAQGIKKQSNYLKKDMSMVRMFEETLKQCKASLLAFENQYSKIVNTTKQFIKYDDQLSEKRAVLLKYFEINMSELEKSNKQPIVNNYSIEISLAN
ncbi:hypothetical protein ABPG74_001585 [Tetrahymena malaccensis]